MSTIKEIAYLAGVSRGTVDRVLNSRGSVNAETAQKVREIADAVNYTPNRLGKRLAIKKKQLKFGCVLFGSTDSNPYFEDVVSAIKRKSLELEDYGVKVELRCASLHEPEKFVQIIDELVLSGVHGLVLTPVDNPEVVGRIGELREKGIPVVTIDSDLPEGGRLAYVGSNSFSSGRTAANLMALFTAGKAKVGVVMGSSYVKNHVDRVAGFNDYIVENKLDIRVVGVVTNHDEDIESYTKTKELLEKNPEIDALFLAAAGVKGACRAVKDTGRAGELVIISFDTVPYTKQMLAEGIISATIGQQPEVQGRRALDILLDYLGMDIPPIRERYYTKTEIYIKENID